MWNRVVLVMCGMIIGWGTANYLTCAPGDLPRHRYRIGLGVVIALALALWMGWTRPASGITAAGIVAFCALIAYAARARQISSTREQSIIRDSETDQLGQQRAVILVAQAHPEHYAGPEHWVAYLRPSGGTTQQDSQWFSRPRVLARIRRSYGAGQARPSTATALASLAEQLTLRLDNACVVRKAHPFAAPTVTSQLLSLALQEVQQIAVVPIDLSERRVKGMADQIALSRADQQGATVVLLDTVQLGIWTEEAAAAELEDLTHGHPLKTAVTVPAEAADHLARIIQHAFQSGELAGPRPELSETGEATTQAYS